MVARYQTSRGYVRVYDSELNIEDYEHRYVWLKEYGFIPEGYHIHHIDGNKANNVLSNLSAIEGREHLRLEKLANRKGPAYANQAEKSLQTRRKHTYTNKTKIICIENGRIFDSVIEAAETLEGNCQNIDNALNGRQNTAYGYHWKYYAEEEKNNGLNLSKTA